MVMGQPLNTEAIQARHNLAIQKTLTEYWIGSALDVPDLLSEVATLRKQLAEAEKAIAVAKVSLSGDQYLYRAGFGSTSALDLLSEYWATRTQEPPTGRPES